MPGPRLLVIEGNLADLRDFQVAAIGYDAGTGYARVLRHLSPDAVCDTVSPADGDVSLPAGVGLLSYDGAVVTGSALNISQGGPAVVRQIELVRAALEAGLPVFGSCWGLQVAVTAAGGSVRINPRGREFGFGRRILLTDAGREHPMFTGKPDVFEAPTVHRDDIEALPADAHVLATNEMGLQAVAFTFGRGTFWGVQYHPEYSYLDLMAVTTRYGQVLVDSGMFANQAAVEAFIADLVALRADPTNAALLWKHGLGAAMSDEAVRTAELANWLAAQVLPRRAGSR
jgi:GMP synthase (glutamine-hydrolysing)